MPSTYSANLGIELIANGEQSGTWGDTTNRNFQLFEQSIAGLVRVVLADANVTLTATSGASNQARNAILIIEGTATATRDVIIPGVSKLYIISNSVTGDQDIRIKTATGVAHTIIPGVTAQVYCDGLDVFLVSSNQTAASGTVTSITAEPPLTGGTITGSGTIGLATVPSLVPGTYGSATNIPVLSVDAYGRVVFASTVAIGGGAGTGTVTQINTGAGLTGGPITTVGTVSLATTGVSSGTFGSNSAIPRLTIDVYGRITAITTVAPLAGSSISNTGGSVTVSTTNVTVDADNGFIVNGTGGIVVTGPAVFNGNVFGVANASTWSLPSSVRFGGGAMTLRLGSDSNTGSAIWLSHSGINDRGMFWSGSSLFVGRGDTGGNANTLSFPGDTSASSATFSVGTVFKTGGGTFAATSDERLKDIQGPYNKGLSELKELQPICFTYKNNNDRKVYVGLSAQKVTKTSFRSIVFKKEDGYLAIDNSELLYALINAVVELEDKILTLGE